MVFPVATTMEAVKPVFLATDKKLFPITVVAVAHKQCDSLQMNLLELLQSKPL
jgi:hypothetical protein